MSGDDVQSAATHRAVEARAARLIAFAIHHGLGDDVLPAGSVLAELAAYAMLADTNDPRLHLRCWCANYRSGKRRKASP